MLDIGAGGGGDSGQGGQGGAASPSAPGPVDAGGQPGRIDNPAPARVAPIQLSGVRRDASGRFAPPAETVTATPPPAGPQEIPIPEEGGEPQVPATPQKFKLGDQEFDTQEAADKEFRRLAAQARIARSSQGAADKRYAELQRELAELKGQFTGFSQVRQQLSPQDADLGVNSDDVAFKRNLVEAERYIEGLDPSQRAEARAILNENIYARAIEQAEKRSQSQFTDKFGELLTAQEHLSVARQADELFDSVGSLRKDENDPNSPLAFPEISDPAAQKVLANQWNTFRQAIAQDPQKVVNHPSFAKLLVYAFRGWRQASAPPPAPPAPAPPAPTAPATTVGANRPSTSTLRAAPPAPGMLPNQRLRGVLPRGN